MRLLPTSRAGRPTSVLLLLFAFTIVGISTSRTRAEKFPEPSLYPLTPELKFTHGMPKRVVVQLQGEPNAKAYWYMTYTVTNENKDPVRFLPQFDMLTNDGRMLRSDRNIDPAVFNDIKRREGNKLLESARQIEGLIQPGEDQARDGVAIWPEPMARMGTFSIFCGSLSGETVIKSDVKKDQLDALNKINEVRAKQGLPKLDEVWWQEVGVFDPRTPISEPEKGADGEPITLHKTLQLTFHIAGDEIRPGEDEVHSKGQAWVMR